MKLGNVNARRHGHTHRAGDVTVQSPTYMSWSSMLKRCSNPSSKDYKSYGGRGVTVCDRWHSFDNFLADMGEKPIGLSIDRRDNDRGYEPGNCRWATTTEQNRNRRGVRLSADLASEIRGRSEHGEPNVLIATRLGVSRQLIGMVVRNEIWT